MVCTNDSTGILTRIIMAVLWDLYDVWSVSLRRWS